MKKSLTLILILLTTCISAKPIKILEVPSEIGADKRGASLGPRAIEIAAINANSDFFHQHATTEIEPENQALYLKQTTPYAKNINAFAKVMEKTSTSVAQIMREKNTFLIVIAGDHSTAAGTLAGMKKAFPKQRIGVIWIDAHADLHSPYTSPSGNLQRMPVAIALSEDNHLKKKNKPDSETIVLWEKIKEIGGPNRNIQPSDLVYLTVRDKDPQEEFLMRKYNLKNYPLEDIRGKGIEEVISEILRRLRHCDVIYLSFDVNSMNSPISQGTDTPAANGLTKKEAENLLLGFCASPKVRCLEFAEVNPLLDQQNQMAETIFHMIHAISREVEK
ncbi:Arginase [Waddlia chondrophila 2032/99]|uniref:Arginase n=1 Tax=Waddlia chondrophila 2032/99 TaxID=765953 RepID=F8LET7_9BACT|nr:Arginase [Waddlia chondrophila 2032/99]